ncbi:solute carrier family 35 member G1-like [Apostichopus japonicus]|uniref:solute carrier family 35 member G1-like n=1 Tax=Stichopus japonicus TaxID=307972 RepID=UPI003AB2F6A3
MESQSLKNSEKPEAVTSKRWSFNVAMVIHRYRGLIATFGCACAYACMALLVSSLADEISSITLAFSRALISSLLGLIAMCQQGTRIRISSMAEFKFHTVNTVFTAAATLCQFYAYQHMPAADASAIIYGYVAFAGLYGRLLLKEPFGLFGIIMVILTFTGILMIARPPFLFQLFESGIFEATSDGLFPPLVAFAGIQAISLNIVTLRAMGRTSVPVMKTLFYTMTFSAIILAIPITPLGQWSIPDCTWGRFRMVLAAVCSCLGYVGLSYGLSVENTLYVSLVSMNDFFIVFLLSIIFLGFKPTLLSVAGMVIIIGSSIIILVRKIFTSRNVSEQQSPTKELEPRIAENEPALSSKNILKVSSV